MKIVRRSRASWWQGIPFVIPSVWMYFMFKVVLGIPMVREWVWWVGIALIFTIWAFVFQVRVEK